MQILSSATLLLQESNVCPRHIIELYVYKRFNGVIISYGLDCFTVIGNCTEFVEIGDFIIISSSDDIDVEHEITNLVPSSSGSETTVTCSGLGTLSINVPNSDYFYKKFDLTRHVIDDGVGDLRKNFEFEFGKLRPYQLNLSLLDDNDEYILSGTKLNPGIFFKDIYISEVVAAVSDHSMCKLTLYEHTTDIYDRTLFLENTISVITGTVRNKQSKIVTASDIGKYIWIYDDISSDIVAGDKICINFQPKFLCKLKIGIKGDSDNNINVFYGVIYPKNIVKANNRVDLILYSLIKDFDENLSLKVSNETTILPKLSGIRLIGYEIGTCPVEKEKVAVINYKFPSGNQQGVIGLKITKCSSDTKSGTKRLLFRRPDMFQWDDGSWTQFATELDDQTLTSINGSTITVDVRPSDYSKVDAEELVYIQAKSKLDVNVIERGPISLSVDEGDESQIFTKFFRIWVDASYSAGTINDDADITDVSNGETLAIKPQTIGAAWATYFCSRQKFGGIRIVGIKNKGTSLTNLIWEYSLSFGTDPNCFDTLTNVVDGTNGFSQDGIITWDVPDDWQMKSKIGSSSDYHIYCIRVRKTSSSTSSVVVYNCIPIITCFGKEGDIFKFDCYYDLLLTKDMVDEVVVRYDDNFDLILCTWKQCIKVSQLIEELIDASGYGKNKNLCDTELVLPKPMINIWGKPFASENRSPTAMCMGEGSCEGYIFVCYKNSIFRLKSYDDEWELIFECNPSYSLFTIQYFDRIRESLPGYKYFLIAIGFLETPESYNESDYRIQPKQIIIRIDDINTDNYYVTFDIVADGGTVYGALHGFSDGEGLIDTRYILRSGAFIVQDPGPPPDRAGVIGQYNPLSQYSENLVIPFNQLVFRHCDFAYSDDVEMDITSLTNARDTMNGDLTLPVYLEPGYYFIGAIKTVSVEQYDMAVRSSLGQTGGFCKIYFNSLGGDVQHGIFGQIPQPSVGIITSLMRRFCFQSLAYGYGAYQGDLKTGELCGSGLMTESNYESADFVARDELMCAVHLPSNGGVGPTDDYILMGIYRDFYQLTGVDKYNEKSIELTTARKVVDQIIITDNMEIYHYDKSLDNWSPIATVMPISVQLDEDDELLIADSEKFGRILFDVTVGTNAPDVDIYFSDGDGGFFVGAGAGESLFPTLGLGNTIGLYDNPLWRQWFKDDGADGNIVDKYIMRIVQNDATTVFTVNSVGSTRRILWVSHHDDYWSGATKLNDFVPLDICYNEVTDCAYGCMLDQISLDYVLFCLVDVKGTCKDTSSTHGLQTTQITNVEMQLVGFVADDDNGYCYFVAADRKYKRKTAILYRAKYDAGWTLEKLVEIKPGEWDCPTKLVYINGRVFGFTAPNYNYFWEWADSFDLRLPVARFGMDTITDSLNNLTMLINRIVLVDENAVTYLKERLETDPAVNKEWHSNKHLINIEFVRSSQSVSGVIVNWSDENEEFKGTVNLGDIGINNEVMTIDNPFITYPELAFLVGYIAWTFFVKDRSQIEGTCIFLHQHQLFDTVRLYLDEFKSFKNIDIDTYSRWQITSYTLSWKRKNVHFNLLEGDKEFSNFGS